MLNISEVRINKINRGSFLGYASILIDKSIIINGIALFEGQKGRYIRMPLNLNFKKTKRNIAYPITNDAREKILDAISKKYDEEKNNN